MRSITIVIIAMLLSLSAATAQTVAHTHLHYPNHKHDSLPQKPMRQRNGIWYTPVFRNTTINGVAAGVYASPYRKRDTLKVNGLSIEADPVPVVVIPLAALELLMHLPMILQSQHKYKKQTDTAVARIRKQRYDSLVQQTPGWRDTLAHSTINGLSISSGLIKSKMKINGAAINATCAAEKEMNGVEVSGLINIHTVFHGVIAAPVNATMRGKGVQIGLYNRSKGGKLLQIGLLNTIGKRTTPFINFSLKRHPKPNDV